MQARSIEQEIFRQYERYEIIEQITLNEIILEKIHKRLLLRFCHSKSSNNRVQTTVTPQP